jgi:PAS domain S-box-containing protein/putative nucleotidyltransferase with HDIG domain
MNKKISIKNKVRKGPVESKKLLMDKKVDIKELFDRIEDLKVVSSINRAANMGYSLKEIIRIFAGLTKKIFSSNGATVYLLSSDNKFLVMQNYTTPRNLLRKVESLIRIKIKEVKFPVVKNGFYYKALERKRPLVLNKPVDIKKSILEFVESIKPRSEKIYKSVKKLVPAIYHIIGIKSVMIVPLVSNGESIGIIDIGGKRSFKEDDLDRMMTISREITTVLKRKSIEDELSHTNKELNLLLEMNIEGVRFIDKDFNVLKVNKKFCMITGVNKKKNLASKCYSVFSTLDCRKPTCVLKQILDGEKKVRKEINVNRIDGKTIPCILTAIPLRDTSSNIIGIVENFNDISDVREAEKSLLESRKKYRELAETLDVMVVEMDTKGKITYVNREVFDKTGYTKKDLDRGYNIMQMVTPADKIKIAFDFFKLLKGRKAKRTTIYEVIRKDGTTFRVISYPNYLLDGKGKITGIRAVLVDLTDVEVAEKKLKEVEEKYRLLFENSLDGVYRTTLEGKYIDVNPALVKMLGYRSREELIKIDIPAKLYIRKEDRPGPKQRNKIFETRLKRKDGSIITVEINSRVAYKYGKPAYYEGIVRDITKRKEAENKVEQSYQKLKKILDDVIETLASIVEVKDPYTSGHQKRVALLAVAMAEELGMDEEKIEIINTAALIHDIGKINLPASVLTRPGKLSKIEFDMIKTHPRLGYDMIGHIEFPKPVADIVLQHHERIDGSGYPQGLEGDKIIPEAKILAVADVVEAMVSHRPYRPALSIEEAVREIRSGRGKIYDRRAVDACMKVIKSKKIDLEPSFLKI